MQVKAVVVSEFGGPEQLQLTEAADPVPGEGQVRIAVHMAGVNPVDAGNRSDGTWASLSLCLTVGARGLGGGAQHLSRVGPREMPTFLAAPHVRHAAGRIRAL
jgi:hypothetical protein